MKKLLFVVMFVILLWTGYTGCAVPEEESSGVSGAALTLMTWNVHNLFDGNDDGAEYAEFTQAGGWTREKYMDRVNSIAAAIASLDKKPDIIMLQEIESLAVLEDIASALSAAITDGYLWSHFAGNGGSATGVGVISRIPIGKDPDSARAHSIAINNETSPRPVLEVRIGGAQNEQFVLFVCHWKSKLGGDAATESLRKASARVILRRMRELWMEEPELGAIIAGDLNLCYDDFFRRGANAITALIPDDDAPARLLAKLESPAQNDFFILSGNKPPKPEHFTDDYIALFSPWLSGDLENGSYYYSGDWETIDHFLLSYHFFNDKGLEYKSAEVINSAPFVNADGIPSGYNPRTGYGLSDHLPLVISLER